MFGKKAKLFAMCAAMLLSGCGDTDGQAYAAASYEQDAPDTERFETGYPAFFSEETNEQDYSSIICYTEKESYPADIEKISVTVKNQNAGKGFWIYELPYVEKNTDGEWVRLKYDEEWYNNYEAMEGNHWMYCYIEGDDSIQYSSCVFVDTGKLAEPLTDGEYRAVVFVGKETLYAPFNIVKNFQEE